MFIGIIGFSLIIFLVAGVCTIVFYYTKDPRMKNHLIITFVALVLFIAGVTSNPPSQIKLYRENMSKNCFGWADTFVAISPLLQEPKVGDQVWTIELATQIATMHSLYKDAEGLTPPKKYQDSHAIYMKGIKEFKWVADNLPIAIGNSDDDLMNECMEKLITGGKYIAESNEKVASISR